MQAGVSYGWGSVVPPRLREKAAGLQLHQSTLHLYRSEAVTLVVRRLEVSGSRAEG